MGAGTLHHGVVSTPLLFLDVDGVLSPMSLGAPTWGDWKIVEGSPFHLLLSRTMAARIAALGVDLAWLTTWQHDANRVVGALLGWPPHPVLEPGDPPAERWWKLGSIEAWLADDLRPFVWVDDELEARAPLIDPWAAELTVPHLLVSPDPDVGLTPDELATIGGFVAAQR